MYSPLPDRALSVRTHAARLIHNPGTSYSHTPPVFAIPRRMFFANLSILLPSPSGERCYGQYDMRNPAALRCLTNSQRRV